MEYQLNLYGTGTPEAGGVTFKELMFAVEEVAKLNIVGFDVNELSPEHTNNHFCKQFFLQVTL